MIWDYEAKTTDDGVWITASKNEQRADWAEEAVEKFREVCRGGADMTAIVDLIANLGHTFDRLQATYYTDYTADYTFSDAIDRALMHYDAERGEGDDIEQAINRNDPEVSS
jgi:hypothetical protein